MDKFDLPTFLTCFAITDASCSLSWTQVGNFCYKQVNTDSTSTAVTLALCAMENGIFPILRLSGDFESFTDYLTKLNVTKPYRVPIGLRKTQNTTFHWADSGNDASIEQSYWAPSQPQDNANERCVAIITMPGDYLLHDYDCELPTNGICQRGLLTDSMTEISCTPMYQCTTSSGFHYTDTNYFDCVLSNLEMDTGADLGFASSFYYGDITQPLFGLRIPTSDGSDPLILATNSSQLDYLVDNGYTLTKVAAFLPNISSMRHIEKRYLYWKNRPPVDSMLVKESEKSKVEGGNWTYMDVVYVFTMRSADEKCSITIDCQWSQWESWSPCSQSCDGGYRIRKRSIILQASHSGTCLGNDTEIDYTPCSEVCSHDCEWSEWSSWSDCSATCENGTMWRNRTVKVPVRGRGRDCNLTEAEEVTSCWLKYCPIDCMMSEWGNWSECQATCGDPVLKIRHRVVEREPKYDGVACLPESERKDVAVCKLPPCPLPNNTYVDPLPFSLRVAVQAMQSLGSTAVIACSGSSLGLSIVFRTYSPTTVLHMGQEASLITAHSLITVFGFRGQTKGINDDLCVPTAIALDYLFIVYFLFMAMEAIQTYSVLTNVVTNGVFFNRRTSCLLSFTAPLALVLPSALLCHNDFASKNSCWVNADNFRVAFFMVGPLVISCACILILVEAVGVEDYYPPLPFKNPKEEQVANICRAGLSMKAPLALTSYIFGASAIFYQQPWMYTIAMPLNICVGVVTVMFHISANEAVLAFVRKNILKKCTCLRRCCAMAGGDEAKSQEALFEKKMKRYEAAKIRRQEQKKKLAKQRIGAKIFLAERSTIADMSGEVD